MESESNQLSSFYGEMNRWPSGEGEMGAVVDRLARLLPHPFVGFQRAEGALLFRVFGSGTLVDPSAAAEFLKRKFELAKPSVTLNAGVALRQISLDPCDVPWRFSPAITHLAVVQLTAQSHSILTGDRPGCGPSRREFGWVFVGAQKALSSPQECMLLAAAQRMSDLAEIAWFEEGLQLRSQFLSIASHELKTPLTSIYGILQLQERMHRLKRDEPEALRQERQASYLKMVIRQTQRLNELIDGLLDVSRIENGRFMVEPSDADVAALVRDVASSRLALIAQEAGVHLNLDLPETLRGWVDPVRIEEAVTNLIMNAIRFSPEGGSVWIRLHDDGGLLRLVVRDQGPSLPMEDRERIFQPFERAQRTSRLGGMGLGLFISRQIAQLHGGNVSLVESLAGKGNTFEATLPLRPSHLVSVSA